MAWIKRNLYFLIGGVIALALLGAAGFYLYNQINRNKELDLKLDEAYGVLQQLSEQTPQKPHPGRGKVDNVKTAIEQQQKLKGFTNQAATYFAPIEPIPAGKDINDEIFAAQLRKSIEQMQRAAEAASIKLPPKYDFSFSVIKAKISFAPDTLLPLAQQLGEVKTICDVLFAARVNALDSVRRMRVSPDDKEMADYTELPATTNELAVLMPYEMTFRCFSPELAEVLTGFAYSKHGFIIKSVNVEPAAASATVDPYAAPSNLVSPWPIDPRMILGGFPPGVGVIPPAPGAVPPGTPVPAARGGLQTVINEQLLRVNLTLEVVKLQDKPVKTRKSAR